MSMKYEDLNIDAIIDILQFLTENDKLSIIYVLNIKELQVQNYWSSAIACERDDIIAHIPKKYISSNSFEIAAITGNVEIIKHLISTINSVYEIPYSAFDLAVLYKHLPIMQYLIQLVHPLEFGVGVYYRMKIHRTKDLNNGFLQRDTGIYTVICRTKINHLYYTKSLGKEN